MRNNRVQSFSEFNENLTPSDPPNNYIMQISEAFQPVADQWGLTQVDDVLDYEGESAEDLEGSIYSVNVWIKDENLPPHQRKAENQRVVIGVMFDRDMEDTIDLESFKGDCLRSLKEFPIESMKFTGPEEFTQIRTFEICIKTNGAKTQDLG